MQREIIVFLMIILCSCNSNQLPEDSCGCFKSIERLSEKFSKAEKELLSFRTINKPFYKLSLNNLFQLADSLDILNQHCQPIIKKDGTCEKQNATDLLWDCGEYINNDNGKKIRLLYTGNWKTDSLREGIVSRDKMLFPLWYKQEVEGKELTEEEMELYNKYQLNLSTENRNLIKYLQRNQAEDSGEFDPKKQTYFPRMYKK